MKLIALCGRSGAGKDTLARSLIEGKNFTRVSFSDQLKEAATCCFPWLPKEMTDYSWKDVPYIHPCNVNGLTPRDIWKRMDVLKEIDPSWLANKARQEIIELLSNNVDVVVTDVRRGVEADVIRELGGKIIEIRSENEKPNDDGDRFLSEFESDEVFTNVPWNVVEWKVTAKRFTKMVMKNV